MCRTSLVSRSQHRAWITDHRQSRIYIILTIHPNIITLNIVLEITIIQVSRLIILLAQKSSHIPPF